jgi:hypothetical protein
MDLLYTVQYDLLKVRCCGRVRWNNTHICGSGVNSVVSDCMLNHYIARVDIILLYSTLLLGKNNAGFCIMPQRAVGKLGNRSI